MSDHRGGEGPHERLAAGNKKEQFAASLFDALWRRYRKRVYHVAVYERVVNEAGATFFNDHIAFRTFTGQQPQTGIATLSRLFEALGYEAAGCYCFPEKHLNAIHYQHANLQLPKLFISELKTWEMSEPARNIITRCLQQHRPVLSDEQLAELASLDEQPWPAELMDDALNLIETLPWPPPEKSDVLTLNDESQYAAWVLVHGYNVNHFTSLVNSHGVESLQHIEQVVAALRAAGVPMKDHIEGEPGSILRQTATAAALADVAVVDRGKPAMVPWTYAYFEIAERGNVVDPATGQRHRFEGFLGPQAAQLFEITRRR